MMYRIKISERGLEKKAIEEELCCLHANECHSYHSLQSGLQYILMQGSQLRSLASQHNQVTHNTKAETFSQKVVLAGRLLYQAYGLKEEEELPQGDSRDGVKTQWKQSFGIAIFEKDLSKEVRQLLN